MKKYAGAVFGLSASLLVTSLLVTSLLAASAQPAAEIQWEVIAIGPQQIIFFDTRPDRVDSNVERSIVFTFHVLKAPGRAPDGKPFTMYLQRTRFSCLKPEMSREYLTAYNDSWDRVFTNDVVTPALPFQLGTATESISIMACDHFNPTEHKTKFSNRDEAIRWARQKLAGG